MILSGLSNSNRANISFDIINKSALGMDEMEYENGARSRKLGDSLVKAGNKTGIRTN